MYEQLMELDTNVITTARATMDTKQVDLENLKAIQEAGLEVCDNLDRCIDDEILDDTQSLRLKLQVLLVPTHLDPFSVLCSLVSMSDKIQNILTAFEDQD